MRFQNSQSIKELMTLVNYNGDFKGDVESIVHGFSDDFFVEDGYLTWAEDYSILHKLMAEQYDLSIITNLEVDNIPENKNIIRCSNPLRLFEKIIENAYSGLWRNKNAECYSNIHNTVAMGKNVSIGRNCKISPNVVIGDNVIICDNVEIGPFTSIGTTPYYISLDNNKRIRNRKIFGSTIIRDGVIIGSHCSIERGITSETIIGEKSRLGNFVVIGHDVRIGNNCGFCSQTAISGFVSIGNDCFFWGRSGVTNRVSIAPRTVLLASSILTKSIYESGHTLCGFPAIDRTKYWKMYAQKTPQK